MISSVGITAKDLKEAKKNMLKCPKCGKKMVKAKDRITGKISDYNWKYNCKCNPSGLKLMIG